MKNEISNLLFLEKNQKGFSIFELLIILVVIGILGAVAIPQLIASQRAIRAAAVPRTIFTEMRWARQQAMAQQQIISFVYDNNNKSVRMFGGSLGNQGDSRNKVIPLAGSGLSAGEIVFGIPTGLPVVALNDGTSASPLPGGGKVVLEFRPDGTLREPSPVNTIKNYALFIYNSNRPQDTATAISVLGSSGRIKLWKYNSNENRYAE